MQTLKLNSQEKKIVTLAALGGMLEFYDFIIYGVFSVYFAHQFFPSGNSLISVIESYVVFVLGYIARPVGGIIFSHVGDEHGRKKVLIITIILMGISSLGIGILPTYQQIGIIAPILLLGLRLLQGLALGGELPSTYVYISETMSGKRGLGFGITMTGVNAGLLLGMAVNQLLNAIYSTQEITHYGWRLPFIFGGALCLISYKIRKSLQETGVFSAIKDKAEFPLVTLFKEALPQLIAAIGLIAIMAGFVVGAIIFMPTYLHTILHYDNHLVGHIMLIAMIFNVVAIYLIGTVANQISPIKLFIFLIILGVIVTPFSYYLIAKGAVYTGVIILSILEGLAAMLVPYLITGLFPTKIRLTGVALCYNIAFTIFGGGSPIVISSLIELGFGMYLVPIVYMMVILLISTIGVIYARKYFTE